MARFVRCDGCDLEEQDEKNIQWTPVLIASLHCLSYHLCRKCEKKLIDQSDPKKWEREKK